MGNINLSVDGSTAFGGALPSVFIEGIEIDDSYHSDAHPLASSIEITAKLNIKFTKPSYIEQAGIEKFIRDHLGDLKLYAWLSWFDETWSTGRGAEISADTGSTGSTNFNSMLENGSLNLKEFLAHREAADSDVLAGYLPDTTVGWKAALVIDLGDLIATGNYYNSVLTMSEAHDSRGNEIVQISNIEVTLGYIAHPLYTHSHPPISSIEKMFLITAVGHNIPELEEVSYLEGDGETGALPRNSLNNFFGNITYTHLLKNDKIPSQFYQMYTFADGSPFYGTPLQALDGTYHATDSYDFESVKASFQNLISEYSDIRTRDNTLDNNIRTLEAIIYAENNKTHVIGEISNYRSVYPNKGQNSESGKFYSAFILAMAEVMVQLNTQPQLTAKLLYDSLIIDNRLGRSAGSDYVAPVHPTLLPGSIEDLNNASEDFLPKLWFQCTRATKLHAKPGDSTEFAEEYLDPSMAFRTHGSEGYAIGLESGETGEYSTLISSLTETYMAAGHSASAAADLAYEEASYILSEGPTDAAAASDLFDPADTVESGDYLTSRDGDTIVRNNGLFMFDWEKAIRTQSNVGKALDLSLIEKYFNFTIPYKYYKVAQVEMKRRELPVGLDLTGISTESERWVEATQTLFMKTGDSNPGPTPDRSNYSFAKGSDSIGVDVVGYSGDSGARYKYGRPSALIAGSDRADSSHLKVVNFDVAHDNRLFRLEGYNNTTYQADIAGPGGYGAVSEDSPTLINRKVQNGYRLICIEYRDWMDDDVAYYNSSYGAGPGRADAIRAINDGIDEGQTVYRTTVTMSEDNTLEFYNDFVEYIRLSYDTFLEYANYSAEVCSYNNITNSYNQFFIDAIHERYAGDTIDKPWLRASYTIMALEEIVFGSEYSSLEAFNEEVFRYALQTSPETGSLEATQNALKRFNTLIRYLNPGIDHIEGAVEPPAPADDATNTPYNHINTLDEASTATTDSYANYFVIEQPIFGDFFASFDDIDADPRSAAPEIIVSSENYESIGTDARSYWSAYEEPLAIKQAIVEVFFPRIFGSSAHPLESWRHNMMTLEGALGAAETRLADTPYRSGDEMGEAEWELSFGTAPVDFRPSGADDGPVALNKAQLLVNLICRRSTMDVEATDASAKLRYSSNRMHRLRSGRSLNGLLKILKDYQAEVRDWIDAPGGMPADLSTLYSETRHASDHIGFTGAGSYWTAHGAGGTTVGTFARIEDYFPDIEAILSELIRNVTNLVWGIGIGGAAEIWFATADQYKLLAMMNASDPLGPGSFVDIVD